MCWSSSLCTYKKLFVGKNDSYWNFTSNFVTKMRPKCCLSLVQTGIFYSNAASSKMHYQFYRVPENGSHIAHGACIHHKFRALRDCHMKLDQIELQCTNGNRIPGVCRLHIKKTVSAAVFIDPIKRHPVAENALGVSVIRWRLSFLCLRNLAISTAQISALRMICVKSSRHSSWPTVMDTIHRPHTHYSGADKSLVRPVRKQATATEDFELHISYL
jgi:hypothetical protein